MEGPVFPPRSLFAGFSGAPEPCSAAPSMRPHISPETPQPPQPLQPLQPPCPSSRLQKVASGLSLDPHTVEPSPRGEEKDSGRVFQPGCASADDDDGEKTRDHNPNCIAAGDTSDILLLGPSPLATPSHDGSLPPRMQPQPVDLAHRPSGSAGQPAVCRPGSDDRGGPGTAPSLVGALPLLDPAPPFWWAHTA